MVSDPVDPDWPPPAYDPSDDVDTSAPRPMRSLWLVAALVVLVAAAAVAVLVSGGDNGTRPDAAPTTARPSTSRAANPPAGPCGPDETAAVSAAFAAVPPDRRTGKRWDPKPRSSNYEPCADLSAVVVTVLESTPSSPDLALLFHRGAFVGTATPAAHPYTNVEGPASTSDIVVLTYRSRQTCSECPDGILTTVGFQWQGDKVQMLDPPPESLEPPL